MHTTQQTDMYSLAATMYHLLTGHAPLVVTDRLSQKPDPLPAPRSLNPRLSQHMSDALMRAMAIQPADRFPDVASFKQAIMSPSGQSQPQPVKTSATIPAIVAEPMMQQADERTAVVPKPQSPPYTGSPPQTPPYTGGIKGGKVLAIGITVVLVLLLGGWWIVAGDSAPPSPPVYGGDEGGETNPLFPVTLDEWRNQTSRLSREFTREGDHYWRFVRGDTYKIGGWLDDNNADNDEQADVELKEYWIAKHPITVQQYRQFIEAGGYNTEAYWTPNGWTWKNEQGCTQPWGWDEDMFRGDSQPVVGVTWYEATAYANWLNSELAGTLPENYRVRLPTEAEWESAAAYDEDKQRHTYPWGDAEPRRDLADFDDGSRPDRPAVVGERPGGAAACGAEEMVGSVWEPMSNRFAGYPSESMNVAADFNDNEGDVSYRGGGYWSELNFITCAVRLRNNPDYSDFKGLRVVVSP